MFITLRLEKTANQNLVWDPINDSLPTSQAGLVRAVMRSPFPGCLESRPRLRTETRDDAWRCAGARNNARSM